MDRTQADLDLYFLTRNVIWRYRLDQYEDATIKEMLKTVRSTVSEIKREIFDGDAPQNADALVAELEALSAGLRRKIGEDVATMSGVAAEYSATEHAAIMSLDGAVRINTVALSAAQFQSFLGGSSGGTPLPQWVDDAWGHVVSDQIKRNLNIAVLRGEGYQKAVRGLLDSTIADFTEREAVTIARTYVQTANVAAQMAVYQANDDLVKGWEWSAVLEPGYSKSGRGTCLRCQSLDGRRFKLGEGPPIPLHSRCRCIARPWTKSWRELGIDRDEIEQAIRPYTIRPDANIDAGGMRTIIESGRHQGDYGTWWAKQPKAFQINAVGPGRYELLKSGKIQFGDLVDAHGRLRTLAELTVPANITVEQIIKGKRFYGEKVDAIFSHIGKVGSKPFDFQYENMANPERMRKVNVSGLEFVFPDTDAGRRSMANQLYLGFEANTYHPELRKYTSRIILTSQENKYDDYWRAKVPGFTRSAATAGADNTITIYGNKSQSTSVIAHEMGHNLAAARFGSATTVPDHFYMASATEGFVSEYAKNSFDVTGYAENFAEAMRLFTTEESRLSKMFPNTHRVTKRILEEPTWKGEF